MLLRGVEGDLPQFHLGLGLRDDAISSAAVSFEAFCKAVDPRYQNPPHIQAIIDCLEAVRYGDVDRLLVFMPPRHGKSHTISGTFPAWYLGLFPDRDVMLVSYQQKLAKKFSHRVRSIMRNKGVYGAIFPDVKPLSGRQELGEWSTTHGGTMMAYGITGGVTGRGAHLIVMDDMLSGRLDASSPTIRDNVWDVYQSDIYTRLHPGGALIVVSTRWHEDDPAGRMLRDMARNEGDRWHVLEMPAIDPETGEALWPERYPLPALERIKQNVGIRAWNSLYQQSPTELDGDIIRRDAWKAWPEGKPLPQLVYLLQVWDTAIEEHEQNDYSACTTWGVWRNEETQRHEIMLLDMWQKQVHFAELRQRAADIYGMWNESKSGPVDVVLVEPKATGKPLISELNRAGIPCQEFHMVRGDKGREVTKIPKAELASVVWETGAVWYVPGSKCAEPVISQCAGIGGGAAHDDLADTAMMAVLWLRRSWWLQSDNDTTPALYPHESRIKLRGAPRNDLTPEPVDRDRDRNFHDRRKDAEYRELGIT